MDVEQPDERTLDLREEELVVQRTMRDVGEAHTRTRVEEVPARPEVEANAGEVEVEHVPVGQVVSERVQPYQEGDVLVVPERVVIGRATRDHAAHDPDATQPRDTPIHHDTLAGSGMDQDPLA